MNEADRAKAASYQFEARKDALRQTQDGGVKVTLSVHPQDMPPSLYGDPMGQRFVVVMVPIGDNEEPLEKKKNYVAAAKLLAASPIFHTYLEANTGDDFNQESAEAWIEEYCGVTSCRDIKPDTQAGREFSGLYARFKEWEDER